MKALVIGATGATGKDLLELLLNDDSFHNVDIFVRRALNIKHNKLKVHVIDFDKQELWKHLVKGDVLFSCLGTTLKVAGSKEAQWKVDYEYQYQFAKFARENGVDNYVLVSSGYSSSNSRFFYTRMKGQLEEAIKALRFPKLTIFNPPLLIRQNTDRPMEAVSFKVIQFVNKIGIFRSQKPLATDILAQAMINSAKTKEGGVFKLEGKAIWECAKVNYE
ncbi:semialdehyde dehydrogenase [Bacillus sp. AFS002410]|uniref:NAD(P)H-binding protein n=1 Tax=Bacillus sp. AFS002410 TaxID=2033481 RepID=UPI000BF225F2|nr:NAD(P)H-binding protein [Bacillus sp. AFS002410]PEJ54531.1 semialdehyde dehydrogenase [Bacillus sp. AFS002410]